MKGTIIYYLLIFILLVGCVGPGTGDFDIDLGENYSVISTSPDSIVIAPRNSSTNGWEAPIIPSKVTEVSQSENFILAKQIQELDDSDNHSTKINYWILNIVNDDVHGPLNEDEFETLTIDLNIHDIDFKDVKELYEIRNP
ncbi:DUF3997 domain-containing protein [Salipaludibacillus agaradhaerens]|jgi:hypothetical protein|uniref:DUF3997 domain-containing protein n=1 Tax=Salipaludibacillus agaradhaerens TaxID=76935 RepID=A0A9Q4AZF1_SALAG|nr:DUF3997 domain-containing protein [Salipaludibacillus agaradhaerens]MCR6095504.1 DUF3997 domain-containing protein [Salipaludibacillus agaradhaerens]MCR6114936.1 DUF3997 domain-containing protein [Salipaludibacillus agaradhaerens]